MPKLGALALVSCALLAISGCGDRRQLAESGRAPFEKLVSRYNYGLGQGGIVVPPAFRDQVFDCFLNRLQANPNAASEIAALDRFFDYADRDQMPEHPDREVVARAFIHGTEMVKRCQVDRIPEADRLAFMATIK